VIVKWETENINLVVVIRTMKGGGKVWEIGRLEDHPKDKRRNITVKN